ncbi:MAG: iron-sulfur cluster assembly scaffold protein [Acidobacteria bacterium]|nr:iron-sulfur cluster assembly scaffold protein [Acidobacteriota bacterium]
MFRSPVLDHFHHPRNLGVVDQPNRSYLEQDNPWSIRILLTLSVEDGRIQEVKFKTQGCITSVACSSALTEMVQGKDVEDALSVTEQELSDALGTIPPEKMHCYGL